MERVTRIPEYRTYDANEKKMHEVISIDFSRRQFWIDFTLAPYSFSNAPLLEYTGMLDKNDTKIFECDILELRATYYDTRRDAVVYDPDMHGFMVDGRYLHDFGKYWSIEIIGNIYEQPELLQSSSI